MKLTEKEWARVDEIVDKCGCSIDEALDMLKADKEIDKGNRVEFDLSIEDEKAAKKWGNSTEKKKVERKRAENPTKRMIINEIYAVLDDIAENVAIANPERIVTFEIGADKYEIILQMKRKPKI